MLKFYFCGTDAVLSNVGHLSGAIAYIRRDHDMLLIFVIRCMAHIPDAQRMPSSVARRMTPFVLVSQAVEAGGPSPTRRELQKAEIRFI